MYMDALLLLSDALSVGLGAAVGSNSAMPVSRNMMSAKKRWWLTTTMSACCASRRACITKQSL